MALATRSTLLPSLPDTVMQVSIESEQNLSVSYLNCLPLTLLKIARFGILAQASLQIPRVYSSLIALL